MSLLHISATPVEFTDSGFTMLIDGSPSPYRKTVEVTRLPDVFMAIEAAREYLSGVEPNTRDPESNLDHKPNGFKLFIDIKQGRAPNGFKKIGRKVLEVRRAA